MSNLEERPQEALCEGTPADGPVTELLVPRDVVLGTRDGTMVSRTLPNKERRMVGAWCFADHYGPTDVSNSPGMSVAPHPHAGLQTVSWLVSGEVFHQDSLGSTATASPGTLNLMTAGHGIAHAESSPVPHSPMLHGVQLWVALPGQHRETEPHFEHHADLPTVNGEGWEATVVMGQWGGVESTAATYSPLVMLEVTARAGTAVTLPVRADFEHAILVLEGSVSRLERGPMLYLGAARSEIELTAGSECRFLVLGGEPFDEKMVMWWNFIGRTHDDIVEMRESWMDGERFGEVRGFDGGRLPAPPMPGTTLMPRGRKRA